MNDMTNDMTNKPEPEEKDFDRSSEILMNFDKFDQGRGRANACSLNRS